MATAGDYINAALRKIGILAEAETPSAETSSDALAVFNDFIDALPLERLMIYATQDQVFTWTANNASRTLGPSPANFVGNRPIKLDPSTYFKDTNGVSYPITIIAQEDYNRLAQKSATSTYPEYLWVNYTMPYVTLTAYPVPTVNLEWHFISLLELSQPSTLATDISVPPGYRRFFKNQLAVDLAAEFGVEAPPSIQKLAISSKKAIKRQNKPDMAMGLPIYGVGRSNIITGE